MLKIKVGVSKLQKKKKALFANPSYKVQTTEMLEGEKKKKKTDEKMANTSKLLRLQKSSKIRVWQR